MLDYFCFIWIWGGGGVVHSLVTSENIGELDIKQHELTPYPPPPSQTPWLSLLVWTPV